MNTKEAVKRYGHWAVISAVAAVIRIDEEPGMAPKASFAQAVNAVSRALRDHDDSGDGPYIEWVANAMRSRSKSRG